MIEITCNRLSIEAKGHAGSAEFGKDLVCCAVSTIVMALAVNVAEELGEDEIREMEIRPGFARIALKPDNDAERLIRYARRALETLEALYPDYIRVGGSTQDN